MRLRATVSNVTGNTRHSLGAIIDGNIVPTKQLPHPSYVEISEEDGAFYLLYFDEAGEYITDTWHKTLEDAKSQAEFEFEIGPNEWEEVSA